MKFPGNSRSWPETGEKVPEKAPGEGPGERFSSIVGRFWEDFRGFSSRLARFLANMLTLSKHRVGRVQIALRRGAHVGNLAKFDEN